MLPEFPSLFGVGYVNVMGGIEICEWRTQCIIQNYGSFQNELCRLGARRNEQSMMEIHLKSPDGLDESQRYYQSPQHCRINNIIGGEIFVENGCKSSAGKRSTYPREVVHS